MKSPASVGLCLENTMASEVTMAQVADKALDKVSTVVEKAADAATDIFSAAAGIMSDAAGKYGPQVIDSVLWVVRIDAIQYLLIGWLSFFALLSYWAWVWTGFSRRNWSDRMSECSSDGGIHAILAFSVILTLVIFSVSTVQRITDVWKYTAVIKPELYLVKKTVDMVEKKLDAAGRK